MTMDLDTGQVPTWCPGCGDYMILGALKGALKELNMDMSNTAIVSGIGCGSKTPHFVKAYGFEGLHGRILPVATGIKLANHKLNVIGIGGDGDGYGIGGNHFIHTCRRNLDMTYIVQNNEVYGLTKGQYSPTSPKGFKSVTSPEGAIDEPVNPITTAIASGATFVARTHVFDPIFTKEIIKQALQHKGFALVDIMQICVTYNKTMPVDWFKQNMYKLEKHDPSDKVKAFDVGQELGPKVPYGLFYKEDKATYEDQVSEFKEGPLVERDIKNVDIKKLIDRFR
ncbi:2-oxoacid:ferredoxin oxidoreductase subunit beta [Nanoarchaeota archaeon]